MIAHAILVRYGCVMMAAQQKRLAFSSILTRGKWEAVAAVLLKQQVDFFDPGYGVGEFYIIRLQPRHQPRLGAI